MRYPMEAPGRSQARRRAIGSAGERLVHTEEVTGSIPVSPTQLDGRFLLRESAGLLPYSAEVQQRLAAEPLTELAQGSTGGRRGNSVAHARCGPRSSLRPVLRPRLRGPMRALPRAEVSR